MMLTGRRVVFNSLALLAVLVLLRLMFTSFRPKAVRTAGTQRDPPAAQALVDPAPYREVIQDLERLIYDASADLGTGTRLATLATELGTMLFQQEGPLVRTRASAELLAFGSQLGAVAEAAFEPIDLRIVRADWERVRGLVFLPAAWFAVGTSR